MGNVQAQLDDKIAESIQQHGQDVEELKVGLLMSTSCSGLML